MPNKEIIATLEKPYTENQRMDFIVEYNHNQGCEIEELEDKTLQAFEMVKTDEEKAKAERERLDNLSMTRGDVFEALILAKGLGKAQIRAMIEQAELDTVTKALYLNRFDEALDFYRGYPIFNLLCKTLDITPKMLDKFFETKDYKYLTTCTLTVNVIPAEATVTGAGACPYDSTIDVIAECEGYITYAETLTLTEDVTLDIELEAANGTGQVSNISSNSPVVSDEVIDNNTTSIDKSDVQDELDMMTDKSNKTGTDNV